MLNFAAIIIDTTIQKRNNIFKNGPIQFDNGPACPLILSLDGAKLKEKP